MVVPTKGFGAETLQGLAVRCIGCKCCLPIQPRCNRLATLLTPRFLCPTVTALLGAGVLVRALGADRDVVRLLYARLPSRGLARAGDPGPRLRDVSMTAKGSWPRPDHPAVDRRQPSSWPLGRGHTAGITATAAQRGLLSRRG